MTKIKMIQTKDKAGIAMQGLFLSLEPLIFEFVSKFGFRISNFVDRNCLNHALWGEIKAGSSEPGFFTRKLPN
jgi:hypothetical protein